MRRRKRLSAGRFGHIPIQTNNQNSLDYIASHLGIQIYNRHTAVGDALAAAMIFQRALSKMEKKPGWASWFIWQMPGHCNLRLHP